MNCLFEYLNFQIRKQNFKVQKDFEQKYSGTHSCLEWCLNCCRNYFTSGCCLSCLRYSLIVPLLINQVIMHGKVMDSILYLYYFHLKHLCRSIIDYHLDFSVLHNLQILRLNFRLQSLLKVSPMLLFLFFM